MNKSFLIDTTLCTACRGCQVACKQWHDLPGEETLNTGSYQNPEDLSYLTYKLVRMKEEVVDDRLLWLFFPDQCRHCIDAPCLDTAYDTTAIWKDADTGAILYSANTKNLDGEEIIDSCPYNIPRVGPNGTIAKCDMCNDRVHNGEKPACVKTCPTGAMEFGDREEILKLAQARFSAVKKKHPRAMLLDPDEVNVIYLVTQDPVLYSEYAVASAAPMTRGHAIRKMMGPLGRLMKA